MIPSFGTFLSVLKVYLFIHRSDDLVLYTSYLVMVFRDNFIVRVLDSIALDGVSGRDRWYFGSSGSVHVECSEEEKFVKEPDNGLQIMMLAPGFEDATFL